MNTRGEHLKETDVAIVGWHVRFPGANTIDEFWQNLRNGVESITVFTPEELTAAGYDDATVRSERFVPAAPMIAGIENFDASFFGFSPRDAEIIDPQYRIFIEESWSALEDAGYDADQFRGAVGVFAGANISRYLLNSLKPLMDQDPTKGAALVTALCFNDKDALATLVSYKLNLTGPSVNVQSFCSTSLVAVHMGCQSLRLRESDMVVAGGANLHGRDAAGYSYRDGDILSPDGHCRAFDAQGRGTLFGSGAGAVILKRLPDAIADGDTIHAVIVGSAVNNDGAHKAGYTAPSLEGQAEAVTRALGAAGVDPATIGFVEAHGTGTEVGIRSKWARSRRRSGGRRTRRRTVRWDRSRRTSGTSIARPASPASSKRRSRSNMDRSRRRSTSTPRIRKSISRARPFSSTSS